MPMPVDADGNGPADEYDTVSTIHQVWDANCFTVCEAPTEELARMIAECINKHSA
jgi:hypothetical protein